MFQNVQITCVKISSTILSIKSYSHTYYMSHCHTVSLSYSFTVIKFSFIQSHCHTCCLTVIQSHSHIVSLSYSITVIQSYCDTVLLSYSLTVIQSHCHTVSLSYIYTVIQSHCHTVSLSYSLTVIQSHCHTVSLSYKSHSQTGTVIQVIQSYFDRHTVTVIQGPSCSHTGSVLHTRSVVQSKDSCRVIGGLDSSVTFL
jgi:hypothetical protein